MSLKGKHLYHGTPKKFKGMVLKPSKSCRVDKKGKTFCDRRPKVFTTTNRDVALLFASKVPAKSAEIGDGKVVYFFEKKYLNKLKGSGYIYEVDTIGFKKGPRKKYDEYISFSSVKVIKKIFVPNVYKEIMKDKNIILVLD